MSSSAPQNRPPAQPVGKLPNSSSPFAPENAAGAAKAGHEPKPFKLGITAASVSGGALAAVTAAVAASFFGVGGTIAGAAFGSVVSQIGGAFYQQSLKRAATRIREVAPATLLTGKIPLPSDEPQPVSGPRSAAQDTALVPDPNATQILPSVEGTSSVDDTQLISRVQDGPAPETVALPVPAPETVASPEPAAQTSAQPAIQPAAEPESRVGVLEEEAKGINWKMTALGVAATFVIALAGITGYELISGNPISGKDGSATSVGSVVSGNSAKKSDSDDPTPAVTSTPTGSSSATATSSPSSTSTGEATATSEPTTTVTVTTTPTTEPSSTATSAPTASATSGATATADSPALTTP